MRCQAAVELLIMLAIGIVALSAVVLIAQQQLASTAAQLRFAEAQSAVRSIAQAVDEVWLQGSGAKRIASIALPEGIVGSEVSGRLVALRVRLPAGVSEANVRTLAPIAGSLPTRAGGWRILVLARESFVQVGGALWLEPTVVAVQVGAGNVSQSLLRNFTATNVGNESINVSLVLDWNHTAVTLALVNASDQFFELAPQAQRIIALNITVTPQALGTYSGEVALNASSGESAEVLIVVEVAPPLLPLPKAARIIIDTWQSSALLASKEVFEPTETIFITGEEWNATSVALDIKDVNNISIPGWPQNLAVANGSFFTSLSAGNLSAGIYTVIASAQGVERRTVFEVLGC